MDIIVCVKQVPDTLEVNVNRETNTLIREGVDSVINPFDLYAVAGKQMAEPVLASQNSLKHLTEQWRNWWKVELSR